jgi:hypothetical protein
MPKRHFGPKESPVYMKSSVFKMPGMAFKEGETPIRKIKLLSNLKANVKAGVQRIKNVFSGDAKSGTTTTSTSTDVSTEGSTKGKTVKVKVEPTFADVPDLEDISPVVKISPTKFVGGQFLGVGRGRKGGGPVMDPSAGLTNASIQNVATNVPPIYKKSPTKRYKKNKGSTMGSYKSMRKIKK